MGKRLTYRILQDLDHVPVDKHYQAGSLNSLEDWTQGSIDKAVRAGLIEIAEEVKDDGKDRSKKR